MMPCDLVFFYGTLMTGFDRRRRAGIDTRLRYVGRGSIRAALFDLGPYPAAVPADDGRVWGEVYQLTDAPAVLAALDEIEDYDDGDPTGSLYVRVEVDVTGENASEPRRAWVYFYNRRLDQAARIPSGDYREHVKGPP